jgi:hypothetical protein
MREYGQQVTGDELICPGDVVFKTQAPVPLNEMGLHGILVAFAPCLSQNQIQDLRPLGFMGCTVMPRQ